MNAPAIMVYQTGVSKEKLKEKRIISLEEEARTLKDELMSMNCQLEFFRSRHQENKNMLRVVRVCKLFHFTFFLAVDYLWKFL